MILASVAGEDLVAAVAVDVGSPEGVALGEGVVDDLAGSKRKFAGIVFPIHGDHAAVPGGFDGRQKGVLAGEPAQMDFAGASGGSLAGCSGNQRLKPTIPASWLPRCKKPARPPSCRL